MKKSLYLFAGVVLTLSLIGCNPASKQHVHKINEYGECSGCGEYLGAYPSLSFEDNVIPALKENDCFFYKMSIYANHRYSLGDLTEYSYEETCWYGHSEEGYSLVATNKSYVEVDGEGKIDGKQYSFLIFKIKASQNHENTGKAVYNIHHDSNHMDDVCNCLYDNIYCGIELQIGSGSGDGYEGGQKAYYRFHFENEKKYKYTLMTSGGEKYKYYYTVAEHQYEETSWGPDQPKSFLSNDNCIYFVITPPEDGVSIYITIYEVTD